MSIEKVREFYEILAKDDNIQKEVLKINKEMINPNVKPTEKDKDEVLIKIANVAKKIVGDVDLQDFKDFEHELSKNLSSKNLESIGGGIFSYCIISGVSVSSLKNKELSGSGKTSRDFVLEKGLGVGACLGLGIGAFRTSGKVKYTDAKSKKSSSWCIGVGA